MLFRRSFAVVPDFNISEMKMTSKMINSRNKPPTTETTMIQVWFFFGLAGALAYMEASI